MFKQQVQVPLHSFLPLWGSGMEPHLQLEVSCFVTGLQPPLFLSHPLPSNPLARHGVSAPLLLTANWFLKLVPLPFLSPYSCLPVNGLTLSSDPGSFVKQISAPLFLLYLCQESWLLVDIFQTFPGGSGNLLSLHKSPQHVMPCVT